MILVHELRPFLQDRNDAGRRLAKELSAYRGENTLVLGAARGGVPVALEIAIKLNAQLDIIVPRKIAIPSDPEAEYGAVTEDGSIALNEPMVQQLELSDEEIVEHIENVRREIRRRVRLYRGSRPLPSLEQRTVILVDDGLASGYTMLAAVKSARQGHAGKVVVAAPVASASSQELLKPVVDDLVCLVVADTPWFAVASFYYEWHDLSDEEVLTYLREWWERREVGAG